MTQNGKLSFAEFNQKLLKYCSNSSHCDAQEKEIVARLKRLVEQRDACLAQLHKRKETELVHTEDIEDFQHQLAEAVEVLESIEKKCNLLALEQLSIDGTTRPVVKSEEREEVPAQAADPTNEISELTLNRFLRKYCNLYVQFNACASGIRVLSLANNQYYEFCLNGTNVPELREHIWSNLSASSAYLSTWESLL